MLTTQSKQSLDSFGYLTLTDYYTPQQLTLLKNELTSLIQQHYNPANLSNHSVYPSDSSESRISHAMMISESDSKLPKVCHKAYKQVGQFLEDQNQLISQLTGHKVQGSSRSLLNYQNYSCGSKPVGEHFDGEYLKAKKATDGIEFQLLEGILPRYVAVLVVENENDGKGVELINHQLHHVYSPKLHAGDLVLFDNIKLRHRVPKMEQPRISVGLRNFDHLPLHFAKNQHHFLPQAQYRPIPEGFVSDNANCIRRFENYLEQEWPKIRDDYTFYV